MLIPELKKLKLKSELVSVERDCHDEELTGFICEINNEVTTMTLYDDDGTYNGFTVFETDQITEVFWGNREHRAISNLISQTKLVKAPVIAAKAFVDIVIELNEKSDSICIHMSGNEDTYYLGKIEKYDEKWINMKNLGVKKTLSPMHKIFLRESISRVVVDSPYQKGIVQLHTTNL